jgi:hypothetical protein
MEDVGYCLMIAWATAATALVQPFDLKLVLAKYLAPAEVWVKHSGYLLWDRNLHCVSTLEYLMSA